MFRKDSPTVPDIYIFREASDKWKISSNGQIHDIYSYGFAVRIGLLSFLELDYTQLREEIKNHDIRTTFPVDAFIDAGLSHGSPHWVDCALNWLEAAKKEQTLKFQPALLRIIENKKI